MTMSAMKFDPAAHADSVEPTALVMGMGLTGASCARYFAARGIAAEFADTRAAPPGMDAILDVMPDARVHVGGAMPALGAAIERVVVSPGVDIGVATLAEARARGLEICSDIDLFVDECTVPICAITGSNGKSTVTAMLGEILTAAGMPALVGGNIGTPALDLLDAAADAEVCVLELSSFQLERSRPVAAAAAVILNVSPDHLDQHKDMSAYVDAKARIYEACRHGVVNRDAPTLAGLVPGATPVTTYGTDRPEAGQFGVRPTPHGECIVRGDELLLSVDDLPLIGRHNVSNAMAALALGAAVGANVNVMAQALKQFGGLPHRLQVVSAAHGITWIDDSKATNVDAALTSLAAVDDPLILIAGGDAKGGSFAALAAALTGRDATVILLGRDAAMIAGELDGVCALRTVTDMREAVGAALEYAAPGYTVLLAPACSSLDMYRSYAERGDVFAAAVEESAR